MEYNTGFIQALGFVERTCTKIKSKNIKNRKSINPEAMNRERLQDNRPKEIKEMFTSIGTDNFDSEILSEKRPVLLAYIRRDYEYKNQIEILKSVSNKYGDAIKVCLLDENFVRAYKNLEIKGDPTFIGFYEGNEKGRILGKADTETLISFVLIIFALYLK